MKNRLSRLISLSILALTLLPFTTSHAAEPGLIEEEGILHYYNENSELVKDVSIIKLNYGDKDNYYKIDSDGNVISWEGAYALAAKKLDTLKAIPDASASDKEILSCLKKAFKWSSKIKYTNISKTIKKDSKALEYYGKYGFTKDKGDCNVQAATFTLMAKVLGYDATFVRGYVPQAITNGKPSNFGAHAWATIKIEKQTYVFDPNFQRTHKAGWKFKYGANKHYRYFNKKKKEIK